MMTISQLTGSPRPPAPASAAGDAASAELNYDSFLKLLIASMKNQDPTKPNDPAETMSQLASFSNVEQSIKLNEKLESLLAVSSAGQAGMLLNKTVSTLQGDVSGIVKSVEMTPNGLFVVLEDGKRLSVNDGLRIS
jgi:flagellar basal-body rod modification protein FlgD